MLSLLLTTEPHQDETLTSFLLRMCQENQYDSLTWITNLINIDSRKLAKPNPNKVNLKSLAQLLRVEEKVLWDLTFYKDIMYFESVGDQSSFKDHVNTEYDKVCPSCFENQPYIKKIWNLKINMACPIHSLLLINICPNCSKKISSVRKEIHKCKCGYKLIDLPKITLNENEVLHSKIIMNAFYQQTLYKIKDDSPVNRLSYYSLTQLINSFWYRIDIDRNGLWINQINTQEKGLFQQLISTYELFLNWPYNFRDCLDKNKHQPTFVKNIKRDFYTKLFDRDFIIYLNEFRNHVEEQTKRPMNFKNYHLNQSTLISMTQAIKLANMSTHSFSTLIEMGVLEEYYQAQNKNFITRSITAESFNNFMEYKKYIVFKKDLAELLGLNNKHINLFEENKWLERIEIFSKRNDKKSYYDIRFGTELITKIERSNVIKITGDQIKSNKLITFEIFYNRAAVKGISFVEIVEELINGSITIYKIDDKKVFKSYYFSLDEVLSYIKKKRIEKFCDNSININSLEICHILKVSSPNITSWTQFGFIEMTFPTKTYNYATVEAFMDNYIPATYLINVYKISIPSLFIKLKNMGIFPISGPAVNGGFGYLYKKSDIVKFGVNLPEISLKSRLAEIIQ